MSETVYLEDIEPTRTKLDDAPPSSPAGPSSQPGETKRAVKRQRTLFDMMPSSQGSQGKASSGEPAAKKVKLTASGGSMGSLSGGSKTWVQKLNAIPFSLASYQETLTEDQKGLLRLECEVMGKSWLKVLKDEIKKPYFIALKKFLWEEGVKGPDDTPATLKIYPARKSPNRSHPSDFLNHEVSLTAKNIYAWSNTPLGKVKVVILGQELKAEYPQFQVPTHGNLSKWAANGVLMLNTCLTVRAGDPGSHSNKGWEEFTDKVVDVVDKYGGANLPAGGAGSDSAGVGRGVVFLAWGAWAAKRVAKLNQGKHLILKSAHPSPHSVDRGFRGNGHFKKANDWLERKYGAEGMVDWCDLDIKAD
ncbi:hypothetical protein H0H81_007592 [Sphagnurus paluster]|uniref:Uracil-DNA glycosylase-like domain-containing protein n=1 Tax=Sphagnurus paluster TaxID=117069 RepID=A0A9P7GL11_9AGAR|nr:hypothetical protein H0H81_007592 [Sphagnurus paluster]